MHNTFYICRRELASFFFSPIAYVILAAWTVLMGFFYSGAFLSYASVSMQLARNPQAAAQYNITPTSAVLEPVFSSVTVILLFVAPLLTMRLFSEEKKQGTIELMLTFPLRNGQLFAGKYLAVLSIYLTMLAITDRLSDYSQHFRQGGLDHRLFRISWDGSGGHGVPFCWSVGQFMDFEPNRRSHDSVYDTSRDFPGGSSRDSGQRTLVFDSQAPFIRHAHAKFHSRRYRHARHYLSRQHQYFMWFSRAQIP